MDKNKRKLPNTHVINKQIINLQTNVPKARVKVIQDKVLSVYKKRILPQLERIFNRLVPSDVHIHLDKLVINTAEIKLDSLEQTLELEIIRQVEKLVTQELIKKGITPLNKFSKDSVEERTAVKKDLLKTFLEDGTYPSWANTKNDTAENLLKDLLDENPKAVNDLIVKLAKKSHVRRRLVYQFSSQLIDDIIVSLYKKDAKFVVKQMKFIQKRLLQQYPAASIKKIHRLIQSGAFLYYLEQGKNFKFKEKDFNNTVIEHVQTEYKDFFDTDGKGQNLSSKIRPAYTNTYQDLDLLDYFLEYGSIPLWADVENKKSLQEVFHQLTLTRLVPLQKLIAKNAEKNYFIQRLVMQFSQEDIIKLLEPINSDVLDFIDNTITTLGIFKDKHNKIPNSLSQEKIKQQVISTALIYHFEKRKNNFIKQNFLQEVIQDIAPALSAQPSDILLVLKEKKSPISDAVEGLLRKENIAKNKEEESYKQVLKDFEIATLALQEIQKRLAAPSGLSNEMLAQLHQEKQQLEKQLGILQKQQNAYLAKHTTADETYLEWQNLQSQKNNISNNINLLEEVNQAQRILAQRLEERLPILLTTIDKTLVQSPSQERTLSLQRLKKELFSIISFFQTQKADLEATIRDIQSEISAAKNSKIRSKLRQRKNALDKVLNAQKEQLEKIEKTYAELSKIVQELTRITVKEGESLEEGDKAESNNSGRSKMDYLLYFLEFGAVPWWAEEYKDTNIEKLFLEYLQNDSPSLRQGLTKMSRSAVLWQRLVHQLQESTLHTLVEKLYKSNANYALQHITFLERIHMSKIFPDLSVPMKEFKWSKVVEILLISPSISKHKFTKELVKLTAQDFNVPPSILLQSMSNIMYSLEASNDNDLSTNLSELQNDEEINVLEDEINNALIRQQFLDEGLLLNDIDKLAIVQDYLSTGKFSTKAQNHKIKTLAQIETLIAQQIDNNKDSIKTVLLASLQNSRRMQLVAQNLSDTSFWQIVEVLMPTGVTILQRYYQELGAALQDKQLVYEKGMLLRYAVQNPNKALDPNAFVNELIDYMSKETGRKKIAIANEWKRKLEQIKASSSLRLYVMATALETLKEEMQESGIATLQTQIDDLSDEYAKLGQTMYATMQRDAIENKGIPEDKITLAQIQAAKPKLEEELQKVLYQISQISDDAILQMITAKNKAAQYEAQLALLDKKIPAQLRLIREKLKDLNTKIETLKNNDLVLSEEDLNLAQSPKPDIFIPLSDLPDKTLGKEIITRLELLSEEKDELSEAYLQDIAVGISRLIKNEDLFILIDIKEIVDKNFEELRPILADIPNNKTAILEAVENDKIYDSVEEVLAKNAKISNHVRKVTQAQKQLLKQIDKADIHTLQDLLANAKSHFTDLSKLIDKDKELSENDAILEMLFDLDNQNNRIEKQVQKEQEYRQNKQAKALQITQKELFKRVKNASSINALLAINYDIDKAESEEIQALQDNSIGLKKGDLEKQEKSIRKYFKSLRTRFVWQRARLMKAQEEAYKIQLEESLQEQKRLQSEDKYLTKSFEKEEAPATEKEVEEEKIAKEQKRRKMLLPPSKPIDEPLFIKNAGLVILSPYLPRYFDVLGLVKNKMWVSIEAQYKGVHLLQYLVNKQLQTPENELVLNKIICGLPVTAPVPLTVDFTDAELKFSESLLQGAINNWARLKTMSPDAMRNTFLIRTGRLVEEADRWKVSVDKGTLDVLLRTITWGFTFLRYPWFEKPIFVEWDYM